MPPTVQDLAEALADPFDPAEVKWKAQATRGERAMAVAYIDARCVMDRLDDVAGVDGWQDVYIVLPGGEVTCRLSVNVVGRWITKEDVGGQSEQPDDGDKMKAAFSDALKRAAVKFGVGRYLYRLPTQWVGYDPQRRQLTVRPELPDWARPRPLSHAQRKVLEGLAKMVGADPEAFCKYLGVPALSALPRSRFMEAMWALETKSKTGSATAAQPVKEAE